MPDASVPLATRKLTRTVDGTPLVADVMALYSLTVVLVTHDAEQARRLGTRGLRLADGRPLRAGAIDTIVGR